MPGVITSRDFVDVVEPIMTEGFWNEYDAFPREYDQFFNVMNGEKKRYHEDFVAGGFSLAREKPEGTAVQYDSAEIAYRTRYYFKEYAMAYAVTSQLMEDGEAGRLGPFFSKEMGWSMAVTQEILGADVLNRAQDSAYVGGDGKTLFATDHPLSGGGTFSNRLASAADLSEGSLETLINQMSRAKDERGKPFPLKAKMLVVPPEKQFDATRILNSVLRSGTSDNDTNALRVMGMIPKIVVNHYLTSTTAYYIITDVRNGLKYMWRKRPEPKSSGDFETDNLMYKSTMRWRGGWNYHRTCYGSLGV